MLIYKIQLTLTKNNTLVILRDVLFAKSLKNLNELFNEILSIILSFNSFETIV